MRENTILGEENVMTDVRVREKLTNKGNYVRLLINSFQKSPLKSLHRKKDCSDIQGAFLYLIPNFKGTMRPLIPVLYAITQSSGGDGIVCKWNPYIHRQFQDGENVAVGYISCRHYSNSPEGSLSDQHQNCHNTIDKRKAPKTIMLILNSLRVALFFTCFFFVLYSEVFHYYPTSFSGPNCYNSNIF